jgi:hypothetical protein
LPGLSQQVKGCAITDIDYKLRPTESSIVPDDGGLIIDTGKMMAGNQAMRGEGDSG